MPALTPEKLATIGHALYGPEWQSPLARALEINVRTVGRWMSLYTPIPDWAVGGLRELVRDLAPDVRADYAARVQILKDFAEQEAIAA